jgi:hypothetical protein
MQNALTHQPSSSTDTTTSVSEYGPQQHWSGGSTGGMTSWCDDDIWLYTKEPLMTMEDVQVNDNWDVLYNAIIGVSAVTDTAGIKDVGVVSNALGFDDIPDLSSTGNWFPMPPYLTGDPFTSCAPANSPADMPWDAHLQQTTRDAEPIQQRRDIYNSTTTPGSDTYQQQWLRTELCDSIRTHELSAEASEWSTAGCPGSPRSVKHPCVMA